MVTNRFKISLKWLGNKQRFLSPLGNKNANASTDKMFSSVGPQLRIEDDNSTTEYNSYNIPTKERSGKKKKSSLKAQKKAPNLFGRASNKSISGFLG